MTTYHLGGARVTFHAGWSEIALNSGATLSIPWTAKPGQAEQAAALGYPSAEAMNRSHDPLHVILAHALGLPDSPALLCAAGGPAHPQWHLEEAAVMAVGAYLAALGVTAEDVLRRTATIGTTPC